MGNDTENASISIIEQRKDDFAEKFLGDVISVDRVRSVCLGRIVSVIMRGDPLDAIREGSIRGCGYCTPPFVGSATSGEYDQVSPRPVILDLG